MLWLCYLVILWSLVLPSFLSSMSLSLSLCLGLGLLKVNFLRLCVCMAMCQFLLTHQFVINTVLKGHQLCMHPLSRLKSTIKKKPSGSCYLQLSVYTCIRENFFNLAGMLGSGLPCREICCIIMLH